MHITRRDLIILAGLTAGAFMLPPSVFARRLTPENLFRFDAKGNLTILHTSDSHAQLLPTYYREPDTNIGVDKNAGRPPHITGKDFLRYYGYNPDSLEAYAYTCDNFILLAREFGRMGGFAHIAALIKRIRSERHGRTMYVDSGDTLQGSATSLWTGGEDMVEVMNRLGCDAMTGHWEFTYGEEVFLKLKEKMSFPFLAQNIHEATWGDPIFEPYSIKSLNGLSVALIGQAFPYTPIANPRRLIPNWSFGIKEDHLQKIVDEVRSKKVDLVVVLSHNGLDVDKKMAGRVNGIDVVLGGHTHDVLPRPLEVGRTLVINSGCYGKFLTRLDLDIKGKGISGYSYRLIPVVSDMIEPDREMAGLIEEIRKPYRENLEGVAGITEGILYRRGNTDGTFDDLICDALIDHYGVDIAFSPGFRWGRTVLPGPLTVDDVYSQTAITYPNTYKISLKGGIIKELLEDVADNLFNPDPYKQQGGDMVRTRGLSFVIKVREGMGRRIQDLRVYGRPVEPDREYTAAGWASMQEVKGPPVYDIVLGYIKKKKRLKIESDKPEVMI